MKSFLSKLVIVSLVGAAGIAIYLKLQIPPPVPPAAMETVPPQTEQKPSEPVVATPPPAPRPTVYKTVALPSPTPVAAVATNDAPPTNAAAALSHAVDGLLSPQTTMDQRWGLLRHLKATGQLEAAIEELKQRATANPNDATIPTMLGEAYLNQFPIDDPTESAITGMRVNQSFDTALKIDPANWEAQFFKADAMSYWPAEMNKGPEVIQRLSSLIDQQDALPAQPQFARTYVLLGEQFQKAGNPDYAAQTWQLGLNQFPTDAALQKKVAGR
jgi:tetratricopeptide (TPR) repeat protein